MFLVSLIYVIIRVIYENISNMFPDSVDDYNRKTYEKYGIK